MREIKSPLLGVGEGGFVKKIACKFCQKAQREMHQKNGWNKVANGLMFQILKNKSIMKRERRNGGWWNYYIL